MKRGRVLINILFFSLLMCSEEIIDTANESKDEGISG